MSVKPASDIRTTTPLGDASNLKEANPELAEFIQDLADAASQADPKFQTAWAFTRLTAKAVHEQLLVRFGNGEEQSHVPALRTTGDILNRLKFRLRRVLKTKPLKKIPETDAVFEHLACVHTETANRPTTLRISIDTKAKVKIGPFSRGGLARGRTAVEAADHDMNPTAILVPAGILEVEEARSRL